MMKEQHRASCPAMFLLLYEKEGKRRGRFLPHPIRASRRGASGRRNKAFQAVGHHVSAGEGPSYLTDVVPPNEETRVCGQWSTTSRPAKAHPIRKTWCFRTKKQGFAGSGAPRPRRRRLLRYRRILSPARRRVICREYHHSPI